MAQYLKDEMRADICVAALKVFARDGYQGARMSDIADCAGISSGNIYRYFKNKDDLFYSVVDAGFAATFIRLIRTRVRAMRARPFTNVLDTEPTVEAETMLAFWIENRLKVVIILAGAQGSLYEDYPRKVVHELTRLTISHFRNADIGRPFDASDKFILDRIFTNTLATIVDFLMYSDDEEAIRQLFLKFWRFQISGVQGLFA